MHVVELKEIPSTKYETDYMVQLMSKPQLVSNVAILGHLHHGKTLLSDMLINATLSCQPKHMSKPARYTDCRVDEKDREISIKATPF